MQKATPLHSTAFVSALAILGLLALARPAMADVRYTMAMSMGGAQGQPTNASFAPQIRRTTMVKDQRQREEMTMDMGPMHMDTVTLTECDQHQIVQLDPNLKIYTVSPMDSMVGFAGMTNMGPGGQRAPRIGEKSGTGKLVSTISVQDLGTEKILDLDTHHIMMTTHSEMSGCAGDGKTDSKIEMWIAPIKAGLNCPEMYSASRSATTDSGCNMTVEQHGDLSQLQDIGGGMPVRMIMYNGDKVVGEMDMRDYSTAALDQSLFDVPSDFKQVSASDFQKAQQNAMMHGAEGMKPGTTPPPTDSTTTPDNGNGATTPDNSQASTDQSGQNTNNTTDNSGNQNNNNSNNGQKKHNGFSIGPIHL